MFITNITEGSVVLPDGRELITWLEVTKAQAEDWNRYNKVLFTFSATQPLPFGETKGEGFKIEDEAAQGGVDSLADALKQVKDRNKAAETVEPEQEIINDKVPPKAPKTPKAKKESNQAATTE